MGLLSVVLVPVLRIANPPDRPICRLRGLIDPTRQAERQRDRQTTALMSQQWCPAGGYQVQSFVTQMTDGQTDRLTADERGGCRVGWLGRERETCVCVDVMVAGG